MCYNKTTKMCRICLVHKHLEEFNSKKAYCKSCAKDFDRNQKLIYKYGIDSEQYDEILLAQGGVCRICKSSPEMVGMLVVDHDHSCCPGEKTCGKCLRDLICQSCNKGLGCFLDSVEYLSAAIDYLKHYIKE